MHLHANGRNSGNFEHKNRHLRVSIDFDCIWWLRAIRQKNSLKKSLHICISHTRFFASIGSMAFIINCDHWRLFALLIPSSPVNVPFVYLVYYAFYPSTYIRSACTLITSINGPDVKKKRWLPSPYAKRNVFDNDKLRQ